MSEELYQRLYREIEGQRYDSREAHELLARLGAPAFVFRAYASARRRAWGSAREDLHAALGEAQTQDSPRLLLIAGVACLVTRDYDRGLVSLRRAAQLARSSAPELAAQAHELALRHAAALAWTGEARELRGEALEQRARRDRGAARAREQRAQRERVASALAGPPELAARRAYALVFNDGPQVAERALIELTQRHPQLPGPRAARLRLALLTGRLEQARGLAAGLDEASGCGDVLRAELAALALAGGDAEAGLRWTEAPGDDARLLYLRGRAVREHSGDLEQAASLFEAARRLEPHSVVITLCLVLARHHQDPRSYAEAFERSFETLAGAAPGLLSDAAADLGTALWGDAGLPDARSEQVAILTRAAALLSAEGDIELASYLRRSADGTLRLRQIAAGRSTQARSHLDAIHRHDTQLIVDHEAELVRLIGVRPPAPKGPGAQPSALGNQRLAPRRTLTDTQIEHFLADGYLVLRGAVAREYTQEVRRAALERLREAPDAWVRGYARGPSLAGFDPEDRRTWSWPRIDLLGPETHAIEALSPRLWGAICDLLGGPGRIQTDSWGDYLLLNLCAEDLLVGERPPPGAASWHIDDPSLVTRLDSIRNGLVCIVLFDELRPVSGNTWLALDSVSRVARELAAHPEGVDFVYERGTHISAQCERLYSVEGQAGDVWLMHPLMMHSGSPNRSGRIRWMSNPMVYLEHPLDPFRARDQLSPVELAIRRAIDAT